MSYIFIIPNKPASTAHGWFESHSPRLFETSQLPKKMSGFASHSHSTFCTRRKIQKDVHTRRVIPYMLLYLFWAHRFQPSPDAQCANKNTGAKYAQIQHATQFTQLSRLPYFSIVRCVVVDPNMHNLKLGTCFLPPRSSAYI